MRIRLADKDDLRVIFAMQEKSPPQNPSRRFAQADSVLEQHKHLRVLLDEIAATLGGAHTASEGPAWLAQLAARLGDLQPQLQAHFDHEESQGLFEEIEGSLPEAAGDCARLSGEHESLVADVSEILRQAGVAGEAEDGRQALVSRVRALLEALARHEALEDDLLFRALEGGISAQD